MTISLQGKLRIKRIHGINGPFCVGDLETDIGEFRVKDALLDQFDEGVYDGLFWVKQIYPWSYTAYGRMVIEIRAKLQDLQIDEGKPAAVPIESGEPDPALESKAPEPIATARPKREKPLVKPVTDAPPAMDDASAGASLSDADLALFGNELLPLVEERQNVKLDPTIDRLQFRQQRDRLKALGYSFKADIQTWIH